MNLANANLTSVQNPSGATADGTVTYGDAVAMSGVRCIVDAPTYSQRTTLGAVIADADGVLYLQKSLVPAGGVPAKGALVVATIDGEGAPRTWQVRFVRDRQKTIGPSHWECFLKGSVL